MCVLRFFVVIVLPSQAAQTGAIEPCYRGKADRGSGKRKPHQNDPLRQSQGFSLDAQQRKDALCDRVGGGARKLTDGNRPRDSR